MGASPARKQTDQADYDVEDENDVYVTRSPSSARKYNRPLQQDTLDDTLIQNRPPIQRRSRPAAESSSVTGNGKASKALNIPLSGAKHGNRRLPLMAALVGMLMMALLVIGLTAFSSWWRVHLDDMQYGRPRTFQLDAVVGHNDSPSNPTHFIFLNLNRHVLIIEFPGGDAAHARVYQGPILFGDGQDLTPVTGEIRDVNGDGKPDLIVHIQDQQIVFINDGTEFRPQQPGEHVNV